MAVEKKKILIVEDDADTRLGLGVRLRASNYETVFAADGLSVLPIVKREKPDLIILDIGLPGGDGFLIMERLTNIPALSGIPVIVLSAREPGPVKEQLARFDVRAILQKPAENDELLAKIIEILAEAA